MIEAERHTGDRRRLLGDVLRAYAALQPGDATTKERLAEMLGFGLRQPSDATAAAKTQQSRRDEMEPQRRADPPSPKPPEPEHFLEEEPRAPRSVAPEEPPLGVQPRLDRDHPFFPPARPARSALRSARLSLFSPHVQRALLSGLLARRSRTGAIDVAAIVAHIAKAQPIKHLPLLPHWSIRQSIDVLVDMGDGMQPFRRDQVQLLDTLRRVLGAHRLRVGTFRDFPQSGVRFGRTPARRYVPTARGSILLLSAPGEDLSLDPQAVAQLWRRFFEEVSNARCEATVLSPIASAAQEPVLARRAALVTWDRATGIGAVREVRRAWARR